MAVKAKELRYEVGLSTTGELTDENGVALDTPPEWSPEHLLLAALIRCSLKSLRHHAKRSAVEVRSASRGGVSVSLTVRSLSRSPSTDSSARR